MPRPIHPDFQFHLDFYSPEVISLYMELRERVLTVFPQANELLYHTHVLTSVYSFSDKLRDAFVHLPLYSRHVNLGFNKGAAIPDPGNLLQGTGKWIRHIPIRSEEDLAQSGITALMTAAGALAREQLPNPPTITGQIISRID